MDLRYLVLAGIWLGPGKPVVSKIMQPVLEKIHGLYEKGIMISTPVGHKCLKAKLLCCVFDLPARAMVLNMTQWNGNYGCTYCLDTGTQVSHVRIYLPNDEHRPREEKEVLKCAKEASNTVTPVFGVKGYLVLSPYLNIVKDTAIDYMHAVLEGVAKSLLHKFWLNGIYKDYRLYLLKEVVQIDEKLLEIKPPHEFRRTPRAIQKTLSYWKASEFRAWLLFFSIPILFDFLHMDYLHHLNLLVKSLHILLSTYISPSDLKAAEEMLTIFYQKTVDLYPQQVCTMNVHSLIHLTKTVKNFGPLWAYSCFGFESMNGHLKKHCHGTRNVLPQLVRNLRFHQSCLDQEHHCQDHEDGFHGRVKKKHLSTEFMQALHDGNFTIKDSAFLVFPRYKLNGILYQTRKDSKKVRNSSVCKFTRANNSTAFGSIQCFCSCDTIPVAIIADFGLVKDAFEGVQRATIPKLNSFLQKHSCIFTFEKETASRKFLAVPVSSIISKCVHIPIKSKDHDFVVPIPNFYDHN